MQDATYLVPTPALVPGAFHVDEWQIDMDVVESGCGVAEVRSSGKQRKTDRVISKTGIIDHYSCRYGEFRLYKCKKLLARMHERETGERGQVIPYMAASRSRRAVDRTCSSSSWKCTAER